MPSRVLRPVVAAWSDLTARTVGTPSSAPPVQRPAVRWTAGFQHNGNNPEVIDQLGRSYASRAVAPGGVGFVQDGRPVPQQVFSSNKNMTGRPVAQSLVLTNPGRSPLELNVSIAVSDPRGQAATTKTVTVPPGGAVRLPVAEAKDRGFIAFNATLEPATVAARAGLVHVDVVAHAPGSRETAAAASQAPLMPTEGQRGYRVPVARLAEDKQFMKELRFVMRAAGVTPDPFTQSDAQVTTWAREQAALGARGQPTAFDPAVNRGILGRVNGLVGTATGEVVGEPLVVSAAGASSLVRIRPNAPPPALLGSRPGAASRDVGAYGKRITTSVPLRNDSGAPVRVAVRLATPPEGEDGAQLAGHQSYDGKVVLSATGARVSSLRHRVRLGQPGGGASYSRSEQVAVVTVPPNSTVMLRVGLDTHANSQFPLDLVATRL
ncbi:MAG: hypothetical protein INH41_00855 [Myxococcaceae bacterium]|jgi:hypothetical protein|nr:hypothetical protein [Myxococcaceae bacterium]MCA3010927.1 hypothetical protein [Myxococcaceae bacterium]